MNYKLDVQLSSEPAAVIDAISTSKGIGGWWAKSNKIWKENGDEFLSVDFGKVKKLMKVQPTESISQVSWKVLECTLPDWPGTTILFEVSPTTGGTLLSLEHIGLVPALECFESCSMGWEYFMASLKQYVETGKGTPL